MKEIKQTKEYVAWYEAEDGQRFTDAEQCKAYEATAEGVLLGMFSEHIIKKTTQYNIFDECSDDIDVWIVNIANDKVREYVNRYLSLKAYSSDKERMASAITEEMIGNTVLIYWSYDHDSAWIYNGIEDLLDTIKCRYDKLIAPPETTEQK